MTLASQYSQSKIYHRRSLAIVHTVMIEPWNENREYSIHSLHVTICSQSGPEGEPRLMLNIHIALAHVSVAILQNRRSAIIPLLSK